MKYTMIALSALALIAFTSAGWAGCDGHSAYTITQNGIEQDKQTDIVLPTTDDQTLIVDTAKPAESTDTTN